MQFHLGKKPRWVVSSFSFFSTSRGSFRDAVFVDCDTHGFICLNELKKIPEDQYDGIVFTNSFGLCNDISAYWNFAREKDKYLIVDNAAGLKSINREHVPQKLLEAISFHHTKPAGFGEGGCAIVHEAVASIIRSIINYGAKLPVNPDNLGFNGKLSDPAAAFILQRMEDSDTWESLYANQAMRLKAIVKDAGLTILVPEFDASRTLPGHLPVLFPERIWKNAASNPYIELKWYYRNTVKMAVSEAIFSRIVSIPCHPDVAKVSDQEVHRVLGGIQRYYDKT